MTPVDVIKQRLQVCVTILCCVYHDLNFAHIQITEISLVVSKPPHSSSVAAGPFLQLDAVLQEARACRRGALFVLQLPDNAVHEPPLRRGHGGDQRDS